MLNATYLTYDHIREMNFSQHSWKKALGRHCALQLLLVDKHDDLRAVSNLLRQQENTDALIIHLKLRFMPERLNLDAFHPPKIILENDAFLNFAGKVLVDQSLQGKIDRILSNNAIALVITRDLFSFTSFAQMGVDSIWNPQAVDPSEFRRKSGQRDLDVTFVGSTTPAMYPDRAGIIVFLESRFLRFTAFDERNRLIGPDYLSVLNRTKIFVTAPISPGGRVEATEAKFFEAMSCGCCVFRRRTHELDRLGFVAGYHYIEFASHAELEEKLHYYLSYGQEREMIAENGHSYVTTHHTWDHRAVGLIRELTDFLRNRDCSSSK